MKRNILSKYLPCTAALLAAAAFFAGCGSLSRQETTSEEISKTISETPLETASETTPETDSVSADLEPVSAQLAAMDTFMTVTVYSENADEVLQAAVDEIERLDELLSTGDENSEVYAINQNGGGTLSDDTSYLLERSLELWDETEGRFDIAVYPVMEAWGFTSGNYRVPEDETIKGLLDLIDVSDIIYDAENKTVRFGKEGMAIDFGGIAKGYTSSRIMEIFADYGIPGGLVNLGGNAQVYGEKPSGESWKVGIEDPTNTYGDGLLCILEVDDKAVITSGGYERYFEEDGVTYHHIIDPSTGYPADNGLVSVSIICSDGTLADGLSTSLFIMGTEAAQEYWKEHSDEFDIVLLDEDGQLYISEGLADCYTSEYNAEIIYAG